MNLFLLFIILVPIRVPFLAQLPITTLDLSLINALG
jgi:hypothetical protein